MKPTIVSFLRALAAAALCAAAPSFAAAAETSVEQAVQPTAVPAAASMAAAGAQAVDDALLQSSRFLLKEVQEAAGPGTVCTV